jgi:hypothetical protein
MARISSVGTEYSAPDTRWADAGAAMAASLGDRLRQEREMRQRLDFEKQRIAQEQQMAMTPEQQAIDRYKAAMGAFQHGANLGDFSVTPTGGDPFSPATESSPLGGGFRLATDTTRTQTKNLDMKIKEQQLEKAEFENSTQGRLLKQFSSQYENFFTRSDIRDEAKKRGVPESEVWAEHWTQFEQALNAIKKTGEEAFKEVKAEELNDLYEKHLSRRIPKELWERATEKQKTDFLKSEGLLK